MSGLRWGVIAFFSAFAVSLGLGIIAGNQISRILLNAFVFGFVFFGMGIGCRVLANNFFSELVSTEEEQTETFDDYEPDKEQVNIAFENTGDYAVPEMYKIPGETQEMGNIEELLSGKFEAAQDKKKGIDGKPEAVYNTNNASVLRETGELSEAAPAPLKPQPAVAQGFTPNLGNDEGLGGLPDLDAFTMAFSGMSGASESTAPLPEVPVGGNEISGGFIPEAEPALVEEPALVMEEEEPDRSQYKGNKPQTLEGDFDAKEIALGLRTILSKDK